MAKYRTAPLPSDRMPPGIPYIIGNEAAERFSYYGMRAILVIFMTKYLMRTDELAVMKEEDAKYWFHLFMTANYFFPLLGGLVADLFLGKYRTIVWLSIVYCLGHLALAINAERMGLFAGLVLISIGAGGIKPCVSAHVGDQFGERNKHLLEKVFGWFYFSINFGAFLSSLLVPVLLRRFGPHVAFGVPGVLMFIATAVFWLGRKRYVHIPPGGESFLKEAVSPEGSQALARLSILYLFVMIFWCLYDQTASAWVLQAEKMDRGFFGVEVLPDQVGAINPILILLFIPLFTYVIYPAVNLVYALTPLRKVAIGFFVTALSFCVSAMIERWIVAGQTPHIAWQGLAYAIITAAEVMVSITCLEFSYTQAPPKMKSLIMSLYLLSVSLGNLLTAGVNRFIQNADGTSKLPGELYYWFFAGLMLAAALVFVFVARFYREKTYIQQESPAEPEASPFAEN